jgi:hypothetical protein
LLSHSGESKKRLNKTRLLVLAKRAVSIVALGVAVLISGMLILWGLNAVSGGVTVGLISLPTVVTFLLIDGLLAFITWLLGRKANKPSLYIQELTTYIEKNETHHGIWVWNTGDDGAELCQAKLGLKINQEDVVDLPEGQSLVTTTNFREIWGDRIYWCHQDKDHISIRPDDREFLEFVRVVPAHEGNPVRLEIPSLTGWNPLLVALKPQDYEGKVKVSPMNGRPALKTFVINYDSETGSVKVTLPFLIDF